MIELRVIAPDGAERLVTIERNQIFFGRHPANDVLMAHPTISLRHGRICFFRGALWVEDLKSALGTRLNGEPLSTPRPLSTQDTVEVGEFRLILSRAIEVPEAPSAEGQSQQSPRAGGSSGGTTMEPGSPGPASASRSSAAAGDGAGRSGSVGPSLLARPAPLPVAVGSSSPSDALSVPAVIRSAGKAGSELSDAWRTNQSGSWRAGFSRPESPGEAGQKPRPADARPAAAGPTSSQLSTVALSKAAAPAQPGPTQAPREVVAAPTEVTRGSEAPRATDRPLSISSGAAGPGQSAARPAPRPVAGRPTPPPPPAWIPKVPRNMDETGLRPAVVVDLVLKSIYSAGELTGYDLRAQMKLPYDLIEPVITELRRDKLIDVKGGGGTFGAISMTYMVTTKGGEAIRQILDRNRYVGPAPVTMAEYLKCVEAQSIRKLKIPRRQLVEAFKHLVVEDYIYDGIGPALNSGTAILFYGPPGNGKTAICQAMVDCLGDGIYIPHAIEADGNVIKVYDEHNHRPLNRAGAPESDQRYVYCQRPLIMVGGELTLDMLDMSYSSDAKYYEAPFQMKANGGILLVDDFGRQRVSPTDLLNRWIVPLESQIDFISLITGRKLKVPFDVFVAFATNLNPADLVDDAFLRRVRYKLEVQRPSAELFRTLFKLACDKHRVPFDEESFQILLRMYQQDKRPMNACEPRNLVSAVESLADYFEREPVLDEDLLSRAYTGYFTRFQTKQTA